MNIWKKRIFDSLQNNKIFLGLLATTILISRIGTWLYYFENDHLFFFAIGREITQGSILYLDVWDHKPPLIYYINALMSLVLGDSIILHRVFFTVWMLVELWFFYQLLKVILSKIKPQKQIILARFGIIFYAFWRNLSQLAYSGNNTENFSLIFLIGMYLAYLKYQDSKKFRWLLITGICLSIQVFLKPTFIIFTIPIWLEIIWPVLTSLKNFKWQDIWPNFVTILKESIIFITPLIVQASFWVWYFFSKGALYEFWLASWEFSQKYAKIFPIELSKFLDQYVVTNIFIIIPFLSFVGLFVWQNKDDIKSNLLVRFLLTTSLVSGFFSFFFVIYFPYYQVMFIPIFSILLIIIDWSKLVWYLQSIYLYSLILCLSVSYGLSVKNVFFDDTYILFISQEKIEVAKYIESKISQGETFYAHSYGATFYYLTHQKSLTNHISASSPYLDEKYNFGYNFGNKVISDLQKKQPNYIIIFHKNMILYKDTSIYNYIYSCYEKEKEWENHTVLKRKDSCQIN